MAVLKNLLFRRSSARKGWDSPACSQLFAFWVVRTREEADAVQGLLVENERSAVENDVKKKEETEINMAQRKGMDVLMPAPLIHWRVWVTESHPDHKQHPLSSHPFTTTLLSGKPCWKEELDRVAHYMRKKGYIAPATSADNALSCGRVRDIEVGHNHYPASIISEQGDVKKAQQKKKKERNKSVSKYRDPQEIGLILCAPEGACKSIKCALEQVGSHSFLSRHSLQDILAMFLT